MKMSVWGADGGADETHSRWMPSVYTQPR